MMIERITEPLVTVKRVRGKPGALRMDTPIGTDEHICVEESGRRRSGMMKGACVSQYYNMDLYICSTYFRLHVSIMNHRRIRQ